MDTKGIKGIMLFSTTLADRELEELETVPEREGAGTSIRRVFPFEEHDDLFDQALLQDFALRHCCGGRSDKEYFKYQQK